MLKTPYSIRGHGDGPTVTGERSLTVTGRTLAATLALCAGGIASAGQLQRLSVADNAGVTAIQVTLSAPVSARHFELDNPSRLVLDLPATTRSGKLQVPAAQGAIKALRLGRPSADVLRVVVELPTGVRSVVTAAADQRVWMITAGSADKLTASVPATAARETARPAVEVAAYRPAHAPRGVDRDIVIAIDAGHGGVDPGASGRAGQA